MCNLSTKYLITAFLIALFGTGSLTVANATTPSQAEGQKSILFQNLANAPTEAEGRSAEDAVWQYWFNQAPDFSTRSALDAGIERRESYDFEAAENHLDKVIRQAPDYAEGYNQRAFVRFLRENFAEAITDLEKALELEPNHFGALSGLYHVLRSQNRHRAAMGALQQAVTIHPWLQERDALPEEMWPDNYRDLHEPGLKL